MPSLYDSQLFRAHDRTLLAFLLCLAATCTMEIVTLTWLRQRDRGCELLVLCSVRTIEQELAVFRTWGLIGLVLLPLSQGGKLFEFFLLPRLLGGV